MCLPNQSECDGPVCVDTEKFCDGNIDCDNDELHHICRKWFYHRSAVDFWIADVLLCVCVDAPDAEAKCNELKCSYKCKITPAGPKCYCPHGLEPVNVTECRGLKVFHFSQIMFLKHT